MFGIKPKVLQGPQQSIFHALAEGAKLEPQESISGGSGRGKEKKK